MPGVLKALRLCAATGSSLRRRRVGRCLALLLVSAATAAAAPESQTPAIQAPAEKEPITPVPLPPAADPLRLALGERLFADPRLSHDGGITCSSCHDIHSNGADSKRLRNARDGSVMTFNIPTVFNAALSFRLNWEGNVRTLEDHTESSLENAANLATNADEVLKKL